MEGRYFSTLSLRTKYAAVSGTIILVLSVGLTWWFVRQTDLLLVQRLVERGLSRAEQLASDAASSLRGHEAGDLDQVIEKVFVLADVAYVGVFDSGGKVLAVKLRAQRLREISPAVLKSIQTAAGPTWITDEDLNHQTIYFFVTTVIDPDKSSGERLGAVALGVSSNFLRREIRELVKSTVPIAIGVLVASCLLVFFLIQRGLRPLTDMARLTSRIAQEDFSQRLEVKQKDEIGQLAQGFNRMAEALQRRRVEAEQRAEKLEALNKLARLIISSLSTQEVFEFVTRSAAKLLSAKMVRLWAGEQNGEFVIRASYGIERETLDRYTRVPAIRAGQGVIGGIIESKAPEYILNVREDSRWLNKEMAEKLGLVSFAGIPIVMGNQVLGILTIMTDRPREFTEEEKDFLTGFADQAAVAIGNARLYEETKQKAEELTIFHTAAATFNRSLDLKTTLDVVLDAVLKVISADAASLRLISGQGNQMESVVNRGFSEPYLAQRRNTGDIGKAAERVISTREVVLCGDLKEDPLFRGGMLDSFGFRSAIYLPIKAKEKLLGILNLVSRKPNRFDPGERNILVSISHQLGGALENASLFQETQRNLERIRALREIDKAITSTLDLRNVLNVLLEKMDLSLPYATATVRLFNKESGVLEPVACRNLDEKEWKEGQGKTGRGPANAVFETKAPMMIRNCYNDPRVREPAFFRKHALVSYLGVPMIAKEEILGVLSFYTKEEHEFSNEEIEFLATLAGQAAVAIHNARLYEETERRRREAEELARVAQSLTESLDMKAVGERIITSVRELLGVKASTLRLLQPDGSLRTLASSGEGFPISSGGDALPAGTGLASVAVAEGRAIWSADVLNEPRIRLTDQMRDYQLRSGNRSMIAMPLRVREKIIGSLGLADRTGRSYSDREVALLQTFADQATLALENARLYEETRTRETQLQETNRMLSALHSVAAAASQSLDLDRVLQAAIEKITEIFRFDATQIHIYNEQTDELLLGAFFARDPGRFASIKSFRRGQGIVGKVAESGKPLIFEDVQTDPLYQQFSRTKVSTQFGYRFFAVFPIRGKLKNLGTLACTGVAPRKLNSGEIQLLEALTDQVAVAIENSGLYEEMVRLAADLSRSNKVKDEFLSVMSHELRTPLNVVMGYTGMIRDRMLGEINPEQEKALEKVITRARDQLTMISSILQATQMEAEGIKVERHEFSLRDFLDDLKSSYSIPLGKELALVWDYPADLPAIHTDDEKLKHVLQNLINNAIKFTEKGSVTVSARYLNGTGAGEQDRAQGKGNNQEGFLRLKVSDTGVGIADEHLSIIFERFRQVDSSETRRYGGVGIGLYIVKKFTELLGGQVEVESEPGKGSTFIVTIPIGDREGGKTESTARSEVYVSQS